MKYTILKKYEEISSYVAEVCAVADRNRESFGFLSDSAYEQMASKGQLWVVVNGEGELKGYLIFGGTMPVLKVFQIYSCITVRGHGVATMLLDSLKEFARINNYHSIKARVASDLEANLFWERSGFLFYRQENGGVTTKRVINIRGYSLSENDLFGSAVEIDEIKSIGPVLSSNLYALDLNLLFDISHGREGYEKVVKILQMGFQGGFSICITPEFREELERQSHRYPEDPVLRLAGAFPEIKSEKNISAIVDSLREMVFPLRTPLRKSAINDESDLKHLAYCVVSGISAFVTKEKALLRACGLIKAKYNLAVLSPDELILDDETAFENLAPLNSDFVFGMSSLTEEILVFLRSFSVGQGVLDLLTSSSYIQSVPNICEARVNGKLIGVYFFKKPVKDTSNAVMVLYVDEGYSQAVSVIDHFLELALRYRCRFTYRLDAHVGLDQYLTKETLRRRGFLKAPGLYIKIVCGFFLEGSNWIEFSRSIKTFCGFTVSEKMISNKEFKNTGLCLTDSVGVVRNLSWFDFETMIGPRFIISKDRGCILVPIKENFANGLIGNVKNQLSLLSSCEAIFLLEKAYFRSPVKAGFFKKGGLVAFYVSGAKSVQAIIGFARITYSDVIGVDEAIVKLQRQGVLSHKELSKRANRKGNVHAFVFDNFIEFDNRITFQRARELGLIGRANLVSPEIINSEKLKNLIEHAFDE